MRTLHTYYDFDASAGEVTLLGLPDGGSIVPERVLGIWNATQGAKLYDPHVTGFGGSFSGPVLTLDDVDTSAHADTDALLIFYEVDGMPLPTGASTAAYQAALNALIGALDETAPGTDTASSGLNGRLQRIAQRLTSLIALLPTSLDDGNFRVAIEKAVDLHLAIEKSESAAASEPQKGLILLAVRAASPANRSDADGDLEALQLREGRLHTRTILDAALPAGTANIGYVDVASLPPLVAGTAVIGQVYATPRSTKQLTNAVVNASSSGENTLVAGTPSQTIRVFRGSFTADTGVTLTFKNATSGTTLGIIPLTAGSTFSFDCMDGGEPLWVTASGGALVLSLSSAVQVYGFVQYTQS